MRDSVEMRGWEVDLDAILMPPAVPSPAPSPSPTHQHGTRLSSSKRKAAVQDVRESMVPMDVDDTAGEPLPADHGVEPEEVQPPPQPTAAARPQARMARRLIGNCPYRSDYACLRRLLALRSFMALPVGLCYETMSVNFKLRREECLGT